MSWRDHSCGDLRPEHVGQRVVRRRLGVAPAGPRRARLRRPPRRERPLPARRQSRARAGGRRGRARRPQRVRPPGRGRGRRPLPRDREPGDADRRGRGPGRPSRARLPLDAAPLPARRGGRGRDAAPPLPLARPSPREDAAQHPPARADGRDDPPRDGGRGLRRHPDADPGQADSGGRPRLPRAVAPAAGPLLRAPAVAADLQAAARDLGLRALLPDRDLLPGRGSPCGSRPGDHAARRRDGLPGPGVHLRADGAHGPDGVAGVPRRRARDPVPADDLGGGRPPLRLRQARPPLRARARGRDRGDQRLGVRRLRGGGGGPLHPRAEGVLALRARRARGVREAVGGEGARLRDHRRGGGGALADREVPLGGRARRLQGRARDDRPLRGGRLGADDACARRSPHPSGRAARAGRRAGVVVALGDRLPDVRVGRGRAALGREAPPVHAPGARLGGAVRRRPETRARRRVRPDRQRERARRRLVPDPRGGPAGAGVRPAADLGRGAAREVRLPAGRARDGRAAARRDRVRDRPDDDGARRGAEPQGRDRVPEEPGRHGSDDRSSVRGGEEATGRARRHGRPPRTIKLYYLCGRWCSHTSAVAGADPSRTRGSNECRHRIQGRPRHLQR